MWLVGGGGERFTNGNIPFATPGKKNKTFNERHRDKGAYSMVGKIHYCKITSGITRARESLGVLKDAALQKGQLLVKGRGHLRRE